MNISDFTPKFQTPASKGEVTSNKGTSIGDTDPSTNLEGSFQSLLQQKGQKQLLGSEIGPMNQNLQCNPFETLMQVTPDSPLYQELAAALMLQPAILPQIQPVTANESLSQSTNVALPLAQELPLAQPVLTTSAETQKFMEAPVTANNLQNTPTQSFSVPTNPQQEIRQVSQQVPNSPLAVNESKTMAKDDWETVTPQQGEGGSSKPLFQNPENLPVKVGEAPNLNTDSPDFTLQLSKQLSQALEQGAQKVSIKLSPENLGTMLVEFTRSQDGSLHVLLQASTPQAAGLLNQHTSSLSTLLQSNAQVPVYVEVQQQHDSSQSFQQQNQQHNQQQGNPQQNDRNQHQQDQKQNQDFLEQLRLGMLSLDTEVS